jgi:ribosomal biogenesis protein LAS1
MTYAMAIVRFINGMADPLQTGPYARPISMIAQRLGIPAEIVQLRHQATHEDLPSLNVLRSGLWSCIAYLRDYAMLPLVFAMDSVNSGISTSREAQKRDLAVKLDSAIKRYKRLMKAYFATRTSKAASSTGSAWHGGQDLRKVMRDIEEMWTIDDDDEALDMAREVLLNALLQVGCLVPLARK